MAPHAMPALRALLWLLMRRAAGADIFWTTYCQSAGQEPDGIDCPNISLSSGWGNPEDYLLPLKPDGGVPVAVSSNIVMKMPADFVPDKDVLEVPRGDTWMIHPSVTQIRVRCFVVRGSLIVAGQIPTSPDQCDPFSGSLTIKLDDSIPITDNANYPPECRQDHFFNGHWNVKEDYPATLAVAEGGNLVLCGKKQQATWTTLSAPVGRNTAHPDHLVVNDNVSDWGPGVVEVVLGSTDFDSKYTKLLNITVDVDGKTLHPDSAENFQYYYHGSDGSDPLDVERAPVGLITHSIKIIGGTGTGAHAVAFPSFSSTSIHGVEFLNMGRKHLGNYPWHWHMTGDAGSRGVFEGNSISGSLFRCISIHQTSGAQVKNNVMYDINGNCIFVEDGIWEENNVLEKNLVLGVKAVEDKFHHGVTFTDMRSITSGGAASVSWASGFWLSSLNNTVRHNWVAASSGVGFSTVPCNWKADFWTQVNQANSIRTALWQGHYTSWDDMISKIGFKAPLQSFEGNTAHSLNVGFFNDEPKPFGAYTELRTRCRWGGKGDGIEPTNAIDLVNMTVFKNLEVGVWIRSLRVNFKGGTWSDTRNGIETLQGGTQPIGRGVYSQMTFIGYSPNRGNVDDTTRDCDQCAEDTCSDLFQCLSTNSSGGHRPGGTRVMSNAPFATEDTYDYNAWYPPLHVTFVLYDGPDIFFGTGNQEDLKSKYYNYDDSRYCFAAPRRAPTIFLMTPYTGWSNLSGDLLSQKPDAGSLFKTPEVDDMVCMAYPKINGKDPPQSLQNRPSPTAKTNGAFDNDNWLRDDNRKNNIIGLSTAKPMSHDSVLSTEDSEYEYAVVSQPIFARDEGFYNDTAGMDVDCTTIWPFGSTDSFTLRSKGGMARCKGRKMVGVQIRTWYKSTAVGPDTDKIGPNYMVTVTRKGSGKSTTFFGAYNTGYGFGAGATAPKPGRQTSVPVYTRERYVVKWGQQFEYENGGTKTDVAFLGFLALFHAQKGDWVDFELESFPVQACTDQLSISTLVYSPQSPGQGQPVSLDYTEYNPTTAKARAITFEGVPNRSASDFNDPPAVSFRLEGSTCVVRLTETQDRFSVSGAEASSERYGMCFTTSPSRDGRGLQGCATAYFNHSAIVAAAALSDSVFPVIPGEGTVTTTPGANSSSGYGKYGPRRWPWFRWRKGRQYGSQPRLLQHPPAKQAAKPAKKRFLGRHSPLDVSSFLQMRRLEGEKELVREDL